MRLLNTFAAAGLLAALAVGAADAQRDRDGAEQKRYRKLIAGKVAGDPQTCIDTRFTRAQLSAYGTKLVYRVSNKLVYVSETGGGCHRVARGDALVTRQFQTRLCSGDIAQTIDLPARIPTGSCALGPFVPYRAK